ncbi:Oxoglutarate/iron-dependent dioxygenase - like 10, partial [Theobroma cacao]
FHLQIVRAWTWFLRKLKCRPLISNDSERSAAIKELGDACLRGGFLQASPLETKENPFIATRKSETRYPSDTCLLEWSCFRAKMGKYYAEVRKLALEIMGTIRESLGIVPNQLGKKMEDGVQVMAVNCYPPCPEPEMALGLPPHSDYTFLTIISLQQMILEMGRASLAHLSLKTK